MTVPESFLACPESIPCYEAVYTRLTGMFPEAAVKVDRTQTAFSRGVQFAWLSAPKRKADRGGVVLSFSLPERAESDRIFASVEPYPGRWMHHMLLRGPDALDEACEAWLRGAWDFAGRRSVRRG